MRNSAFATLPGRPLARRALLAASGLALFGAAAAQRLEIPALTAAEIAALPLVGVHIATLSAGDADVVSVLVPLPAGDLADADASDGGRLTLALDDCLEPDGYQPSPPGEPLAVAARLLADACRTTLIAEFAGPSEPALAAVAVALGRSALPPLAPGVVIGQLSVDRVSLPPAAGSATAADGAPLLRLRLTNAGTAPLRVDALLLSDAYSGIAGRLFTLAPDSFDGRLASLEASAEGFQPADLDPGAAVEYALAVGVGTRLTTGSWAVTLRPAFAVTLAGKSYLLALEAASLIASPSGP